MKWVLFLVFSAIAAILFDPVNTFVNAQSQKATSSGAVSFFGSYPGKIAVTAVSFFFVLIGATFILKLVGKRATVPVGA